MHNVFLERRRLIDETNKHMHYIHLGQHWRTTDHNQSACIICGPIPCCCLAWDTSCTLLILPSSAKSQRIKPHSAFYKPKPTTIFILPERNFAKALQIARDLIRFLKHIYTYDQRHASNVCAEWTEHAFAHILYPSILQTI